jgi:hypothetical protein
MPMTQWKTEDLVTLRAFAKQFSGIRKCPLHNNLQIQLYQVMSFKIRNLSINNCIGDAVNRFDHKIILVPKLQHVIIAALILHVKMPFPFGTMASCFRRL